MGGFGQLHGDNGDTGGQRTCKPTEGIEMFFGRKEAKEFGDTDTYEGTNEVTANESSGLGKRRFNDSIA